MDIQTLAFSLVPLIVVLLLLWKRSSRTHVRLPPGPRRLPLIGNLHQLRELPHRSLFALAKIHGPLMYLKFGSVPIMVASSPEMVKEVVKTHELSLAGRPAGLAARKLSYDCRDMFFSPCGEYWRQMRKLCVQEIVSVQRVQSFRSVREREVAQMIEKIAKFCPQGPVNMSEVLLELTNGVICSAALGSKYGGSGNSGCRFQGILGEAQTAVIGFGIADFFPSLGWINELSGFRQKLDNIIFSLDSFFEEVITEHLDPEGPKSEHEDFVDVLLRAQKDSSHGIPLTRDHVKAIIMDMFLAGTDTTFATLTWAMTELIRNPRVMKKVQDEVKRIVGKKKVVDEDDLHQMEYLQLVLKEVLRVHPSVPLLVPRECTEKCKIDGYDIPLKTRVFINIWALMRDAENWKDPDEFWPERFADGSFDFKGQNLQYIPFGSGRRICPGSSFAAELAELALANLLHSYDWELPDGVRKEDIDMSEALGLALHKKHPLHLVVTPRA